MHKFIIADTSYLITLDRINQLNILQKLFSTIFTTREVQEEFNRFLPDWIIIQEVTATHNRAKLESILHKGEASAIALAMETENSVLIIDEKKGRKVAKELRIEIIGTLRLFAIGEAKKNYFFCSTSDRRISTE